MFDTHAASERTIDRTGRRGYVVALSTVTLAAGMTESLRSVLGTSVFVFFIVSVLISSQAGGARAGFLAMILSLVTAKLLFFQPRWSIAIDFETIHRCSLFTFISAMICALSEARWRATIRERHLRRWYEGTLAGIGDAVISTDPEGQITYLNAMAERLTGWRRAAAVGRPLGEVFQVLDESTRAPGDDSVERVLDEGKVIVPSGRTLLVSREGQEVPIEQSIAPIRDDRNRISGVVLAFRDASARRRSETELREAKESAEAANRSKDRFLAVLSHELRTPLTPVLATVTAMLDEPEDREANHASIRPTLEMIRRSVELEARLIDDLLDISRIVHGKLSLDRSPVDAHSLIHQTLGICRSDLFGKRMNLDIRLQAKRSVVDADPARLQQVLWNLIKNAVKFTPEGGSVSIRSRNEAADGNGDGVADRLVIQVADSGIGIDPEALPRIFDAFEQGERTSDRRFGGLGLGLAISRSVIEAHGGSIAVESGGAGRGSLFSIDLAVREGAEVKPEKPDPGPRAEEQPLRILLVEDDLNTLRVLSRLLRHKGFRVTTADNVASAREKFAEGDFDLLVSDIGLPDGTRIDLMRGLRQAGPLRGVALTGFGMDDDIRRCREAGFIAHLTKPVDFQKLEATIRQVAVEAR